MGFIDKIAGKLGLRTENSVEEKKEVKQEEQSGLTETDKELQAGLNGGELLGVGDDVEISGKKTGFLNKAGKYVADWWTDKDKVSKDGKDDGKISTGEKLESTTKGLVGGLVKTAAKNPLQTVAAVAGTAAASTAVAAGVVAAGIVAAPVAAVAGVIMAGVGIGFGIVGIVRGAKQAKQADTDGAAKAGYEEVGTGVALTALSAFGMKKAATKMKASKAEVKADAAKPEEVKPAVEKAKVEPETTVKAKVFAPEEVAAFNESKGVTPERIARRYTHKTAQTAENGYERSITGESGFETETYINTKAKDHFFADRFSKYEYKYSDGRRVQGDIYDEFGKPAYREFYEYDSNGRLTKVKQAEFDQVKGEFRKPETVHSFEYDTQGRLVKAEHPLLMSQTIEYEYSPEGRVINQITKNSHGVEDVTTYTEDGGKIVKYVETKEGLSGRVISKTEVERIYDNNDRFVKEIRKPEATGLKAMQRKAVLDRAGFTEEVIQQMNKEAQGTYSELVPKTLNMIEYLEARIANGEKLTPSMIYDAIRECDDIYSQAGYGSKFQELQKGFLEKYWSRAGEIKEAYHKEGGFFTEAERVATKAAQRKAVLDRAGFTEDVIQQMNKDAQGTYSELVPRTLDMIEYLEARIANGEKLTPSMIYDAIRECDDIYSQAGYGSKFQDLQLGFLAKYWSHGEELASIMK